MKCMAFKKGLDNMTKGNGNMIHCGRKNKWYNLNGLAEDIRSIPSNVYHNKLCKSFGQKSKNPDVQCTTVFRLPLDKTLEQKHQGAEEISRSQHGERRNKPRPTASNVDNFYRSYIQQYRPLSSKEKSEFNNITGKVCLFATPDSERTSGKADADLLTELISIIKIKGFIRTSVIGLVCLNN